METACKFLAPAGAGVAFQKDAWDALSSPHDPPYSLSMAKAGKLTGTLAGMPGVRLIGVPPTRLAGAAQNALEALLLP